MEKVQIPDKLYFRIGEVSRITGVPAYVLRFWENEFRRMHPKRTPSGQRLYRKKDIETVLTIKNLLYEKKFTIEGARRVLGNARTASAAGSGDFDIQAIRNELLSIRRLLS
ncbi:MAG: MerR family transcriptional regulator [Desulfobacterales bacterium]|nr:MerR family transcriptional regulator [Desulfobacterales bacterium]MCF8081168.1 MerR family transcriptional regulator [Desulfobacterales bacterium]